MRQNKRKQYRSQFKAKVAIQAVKGLTYQIGFL
jgi:hypothetical protein